MASNDSAVRKGGGWPKKLVFALITIVVLVDAVAFYAIFWRSESRYLIINADDAGMYPSVNAATIEAMERGLVSSCSVMVPCSAFDDFAAYARVHPEKDFGIHLTLNCETQRFRWGPVLPREKVSSLVDSEGAFWSSTEETAKHARIEEVEMELRAQIDKARGAGIRFSHLDHHKFVLFARPDFLRLYVRLGVDNGLPLRFTSRLPDPPDLDRSKPDVIEAYFEGLKHLRDHKIPLLADYDAVNYLYEPANKHAYFLARIKQLPPGVSEFVIHCATSTGDDRLPRQIDRREADTKLFMSDEMADALRAHGIRVIAWRDLPGVLKATTAPARRGAADASPGSEGSTP